MLKEERLLEGDEEMCFPAKTRRREDSGIVVRSERIVVRFCTLRF